jgi:hypothetical protein
MLLKTGDARNGSYVSGAPSPGDTFIQLDAMRNP